MSQMSPQAEQRLLRASARVADLVAAGLAPDAALEKVARDDHLPRGHVPLLAYAYNIGRTTRQRLDGATTAEKAADFPIADPAAVLARLDGRHTPKTAAARANAGVSPEYLRGPDWYTARRSAAGALQVLAEKRAEAAARPDARPVPAAEPGTAMKRAWHDAARRDRALQATRLAAAKARDVLAVGLDKLAEVLGTPGQLSVADIRPNVAVLHGALGTTVLDHLVRHRPALAKAAARQPHHAVRPGLEPYRTLDAVLAAAGAARAARAAYHKEAAEVRAANDAALAPYRAPARPAGPPSLLDGLAAPDPAAAEKAAGLDKIIQGFGTGLGYGALREIGAQFGGPDKDTKAEKLIARIATPEHEQQLQEIEARAMLHDLFRHDEVLSGHDPHEVAHHFNRLSQFAPSVARKPLAVVPLVRKSLEQGHLDAFDAGEITDMEHKLRSARGSGGVPASSPKSKSESQAGGGSGRDRS